MRRTAVTKIPKHQFPNTLSNQTRNMAGRSRTVAAAISYEDFQPQCERKEEQSADILLIHLPGFSKDQINVTFVESSRTIKVQGERVLEKNRRSRFNQAFPVTQNCIIEKIQGSFRNGVLTITMPKHSIAQIASVKDANTTKETTPPEAISEQKSIEDPKKATPPKAASTSGFERQGDEKLQPPQTPQKATPQPTAPMATIPESVPPKAQTNGKKAEALQPSKQQEEIQKKVAPIATTEKTAGSTAEIVEKEAESEAGLKNLVKEEESGKIKDSTMSETNIPKVSEKEKKYEKAGGAVEGKPKEAGSSFLQKAKEMRGMDTIMKTVKKLSTDDNEDRQLLINIGVSVLVIVALGAYITYSYRSSGKARH